MVTNSDTIAALHSYSEETVIEEFLQEAQP